MTRGFFSIACHAYGAAALLYLAFLVRQRVGLALGGRLLVGFGLVLHATGLVILFAQQGGRPSGMAQGISSVVLLLLAILLYFDLRYRVPVLGAFLTPIAVALLVPGLLLPSDLGALPGNLARPLLPFHISVALIGMAAFAIAAGVAGLYLLLERQMKGKRFGFLFSRLPSLSFLDQLNRRLVVGGFVALSLTLITGAFFAAGTGGVFWQWQPKEIATVVAWGVFAGLLGARIFAGWQGRRVALLTMVGFCILLVSFFSSYDAGRMGGLR